MTHRYKLDLCASESMDMKFNQKNGDLIPPSDLTVLKPS